ncbi:two component transcriptional regulator, LuxR family [Seinonella peptonophila]|uniref:Two component transcriptional regulator, LuxR family n=1 Tax=Seinonella peptonophila TaxID=112248 RepID=A0A1M4Z6V8_9BACL|nr:response regulator transcription factor [Seinonella peptonophila]SHF13502.1 two component transcriptional regulator, LuxR family [Seinonella peptonophila]
MKIFIAEDQGMLRDALSALLELEEDIEVIGKAEDGYKALEQITQLNPDLCILDIEMPKMTGLEVAKQLKKKHHPCKVVIVTTFARTGYLQRAMKAGVKGYLLKDLPITQLADSLRKIDQGARIISPELSFSFWEEENPLTEREQEILQRISKGETVKEIAQHLYLSNGTVRNYISEILQKLEVKNRIEAITVAEEKGWI